jgi:hypothetical protein
MEKSTKKRLKYHDDLLKKARNIDHDKSKEGLMNKIKLERDKVASEIGKNKKGY